MVETEKGFQKAIIELATKCGWSVYHVANVRGQLRAQTSVGYPDLTLVHPSHGVCWAEIKSEKGKLSALQQEWLALLQQAGQRAFCWRPQDWDEIVGVLAPS